MSVMRERTVIATRRTSRSIDIIETAKTSTWQSNPFYRRCGAGFDEATFQAARLVWTRTRSSGHLSGDDISLEDLERLVKE